MVFTWCFKGLPKTPFCRCSLCPNKYWLCPEFNASFLILLYPWHFLRLTTKHKTPISSISPSPSSRIQQPPTMLFDHSQAHCSEWRLLLGRVLDWRRGNRRLKTVMPMKTTFQPIWFIHVHVIKNLCMIRSSVEHKRKYLDKCLNGFESQWESTFSVPQKSFCVLQKKERYTGLDWVNTTNTKKTLI